MKEQEVIDLISKVKDSLITTRELVKKAGSLNGNPPLLHWKNKIVIATEDKVFKLESPKEAYKRLFLPQAINKELPLAYRAFIECRVIPYLSSPIFVTTEEQKVDLVGFDKMLSSDKQEKLFEKLLGKETFKEFQSAMNKFEILPISSSNFGIDKNNKIRVFDWISNVSADYSHKEQSWVLKNSKGEIIYVSDHD